MPYKPYIFSLFYTQLREFPENLSFTVAQKAIYSCTFICIMKLQGSYFRPQANTVHALSWIKFIFFKKKSQIVMLINYELVDYNSISRYYSLSQPINN